MLDTEMQERLVPGATVWLKSPVILLPTAGSASMVDDRGSA